MLRKTIFENATHRLDPKCYSNKYERIRKAIEDSPYRKYKLSDLILDIKGGEWGKAPEEAYEQFEKCLVLRATEIDNNYNISIDEEKAQFRAIDNKKISSMDVETGDIIIEKSGGSKDQPVGRVIIVDSLEYQGCPIVYSNFLSKIKVNRDLVDPYYLFAYLRFIYSIGLTEVMQNQTNGIRNLIMDEFLNQTIIVPDNNAEIGRLVYDMKEKSKKLRNVAEQEWQAAKAQFEKELLGE